MDIAAQNRLPVINLTESAGADLPNQAKIFVRGGRTFRELTRRSAERIPTICLVFGARPPAAPTCRACRTTPVFVKNAARVFLAGPPLVKMAINEDADEESLGGAEMHSRVSGVSDYLAEDELDAIRLGRQIVGPSQLAEARRGEDGRARGAPLRPRRAPRHRLDRRAKAVRGARGHRPHRRRLALRRVQARVRDDARDRLGHLHGYPIGILGNNGILFSDSSEKAAQFIQLCNKIDVPLLFLQNITGFMVGTQYERGGIIKDGAKMINAVSNSTVPMFTVMIGSSYGAGNYGMCGRAYDPRFLFTWPNHRIAVMGPEQLAGVMSIVRRGAAERAGQPTTRPRTAPSARWSSSRSSRSRTRSTPRRACGTTASSTRATRARCSGSRSPPHSATWSAAPTRSACSGCSAARERACQNAASSVTVSAAWLNVPRSEP
jgi:acetyl-CoA carboxylase carboxyltransferase component